MRIYEHTFYISVRIHSLLSSHVEIQYWVGGNRCFSYELNTTISQRCRARGAPCIEYFSSLNFVKIVRLR